MILLTLLDTLLELGNIILATLELCVELSDVLLCELYLKLLKLDLSRQMLLLAVIAHRIELLLEHCKLIVCCGDLLVLTTDRLRELLGCRIVLL